MRCETIYLSKERNVTMETYLLEDNKDLLAGAKRPIIVICPGGGYSFHAHKEGEPIALSYVQAGFHAVVLRYGINEFAAAPGPLNDIADAVAYIRDHADEWFVDKDSIFVSGFSAGAHVAGCLSVFWNNPELLPKYKDNLEYIKPNGAILGYPVLDLRSTSKFLDIGIKPGTKMDDIGFAQRHPKMPQENYFIFNEKEQRYFIDFEVAMNAYIFDGEYTDEQEDFYSLQNQVSENTPPTFIWHTSEDGLIKPSNSLLYTSALQQHGVPFELHIYDKGGHGLALGDYVTANYSFEEVPAIQSWIGHAIDWVNRQTGFNKKYIQQV